MGDKVYISPSTEPNDEDEDDALYQYDDEDDEDDEESQHKVIGSPIFSRFHEPPPRHQTKKDENNEDVNEYEYDYDDDEEDEFGGNANIQNVSDRHFYNARF